MPRTIRNLRFPNVREHGIKSGTAVVGSSDRYDTTGGGSRGCRQVSGRLHKRGING